MIFIPETVPSELRQTVSSCWVGSPWTLPSRLTSLPHRDTPSGWPVLLSPGQLTSGEEYIPTHLSWVKIFTVYRSNYPKKPRLPTKWAEHTGWACSPPPWKFKASTPASTQLQNCNLKLIFSAGSGYSLKHLIDPIFFLESGHHISSSVAEVSRGNQAVKLVGHLDTDTVKALVSTSG